MYKGVGLCFVGESDGFGMRKIRNQKYICLLLAIAMMISGICLEKIPTDSYFSCNQKSILIKSERVYSNISVYRTETLSQREVLSSLRTAKRELRRNQIRTFHLSGDSLFHVGFLPQDFQSKRIAEGNHIFGKASYSAVILSYIHKQDGEKA